MSSILVLVVIAGVSLVVSRIASAALTATGLARSAARFQARSALTGVGFTTSESESVANNPVRRRIVMTLMLVGNVGLVTAVATLLSGFVNADPRRAALRAGVLIAGLAIVIAAARSQRVDQWLSRVIARWLDRHTDLDVRDYAGLLRVAGPYSVKELQVEAQDWLAGRTLGELRLRDEGVVVLGIVCGDGQYLGAPGKETELQAGDQLVLYGHDDTLADLDCRTDDADGAARHQEAAAAHRHRHRHRHRRRAGGEGDAAGDARDRSGAPTFP
ncbi:MAG TPA: TrkA C-terminal domain-containing protein [Acidimicrobiia bacterium]|nr:TrkA C-terminal domain-containing protein [Acidimicrobiia bacterium]